MSIDRDPTKDPAPTTAPAAGRGGWLRRLAVIAVAVVAVAFVAIQIVPVHRTNPPATTALDWDTAATQSLARRACMDCHSNETQWPWYSRVAPVSWMVYYDVQRGRRSLNLSEYGSSAAGLSPAQFRPPTDLAYRLGQLMAGREQFGPPRGEGGRAFPTFAPGQRPSASAFPTFAPGQRPSASAFPTLAPGQRPPSPAFQPGGRERNLAGQLREVVEGDQMPPGKYLLMHPSANLSSAERTQLVDGLVATLGLGAQ
jgi:mono/diheme cytochrome c family protein